MRRAAVLLVSVLQGRFQFLRLLRAVLATAIVGLCLSAEYSLQPKHDKIAARNIATLHFLRIAQLSAAQVAVAGPEGSRRLHELRGSALVKLRVVFRSKKARNVSVSKIRAFRDLEQSIFCIPFRTRVINKCFPLAQEMVSN